VGVQEDQPAGSRDPREVGRLRDSPRDAETAGFFDEPGDGRVVLAADDVEHVRSAVAVDHRDADGREPERVWVDQARRIDQEGLDRLAAGP
jgi:hypothetical protein